MSARQNYWQRTNGERALGGSAVQPPVVSVDPFRCRMWEFHDRLEEGITEESCRAEIASVSAHGQQIPALGRSLKGDPHHDIELIYGSRRLFIARHLNVPLKVHVRPMSDRDAFIAMDIENRHRQDISPYERGLSYARMLRSEHFESQDDLAQRLKVSPSQVSRLLKLAKLPSVIVAAFRSALDLRESWGLELYEAWQEPERRRQIAEKARALTSSSHQLTPDRIYRELLFGGRRRRRSVDAPNDDVVTDAAGKLLFRIRRKQAMVLLLIPARGLSPTVIDQLRKSVSHLLQPTNLHVVIPRPLPAKNTCQPVLASADSGL